MPTPPPEAGPQLPGFRFEISSQLVWLESFLCLKVERVSEGCLHMGKGDQAY